MDKRIDSSHILEKEQKAKSAKGQRMKFQILFEEGSFLRTMVL